MEDVNLHELPRKELKQLCNAHNTRTAGVKHDDLVRLLRNKLYPPASDPPRLSRARSQVSTNSQHSSKDRGESAEKNLTRSTIQGRSQRSLVFVDDPLWENTPERSRKELSPNPGLPRKPMLTKSNSIPVRRSDFLRRKVSTLSGVGKQSQERWPKRSDGPSVYRSGNNIGASRQSIRSKHLSEHPGVQINEAQKAHTNVDAYSEATSSPRVSEGDASVTAMDSSDLGSHSFMSEDSDANDGRSVSSEPITSRFSSQHNKLTPLTSTGSKLGRGVPSWDNAHGRNSLDSLEGSDTLQGEEDIFPDFHEDVDSLVGNSDDINSFLDALTADPPEEMNRTNGHQGEFEQFHTPETSTACHEVNDIIDFERSRREDDNGVAPISAGLPESQSGDNLLMDRETPPVSEGSKVVTNMNALLSESEQVEGISITSGPALNTLSHLVEDIESAEHSPGNVTIEEAENLPRVELSHLGEGLESLSRQESSSAASGVLPDSVDIEELDDESQSLEVECNNRVFEEDIAAAENSPRNATIEEPENLPRVGLSHLGEGLESPSVQESSSATSGILPDSVDIVDESQSLEVEYNNRVFEDDIAGVHVPKDNNKGVMEMLMTSGEVSEHTQAPLPVYFLSEKIGDNNDSSKHDYSRVVVTSAHGDSEDAIHGDSEDATQDIEPLKHPSVPEKEAMNHVEPVTNIDVERHESGDDEKFGTAAASSSVNLTQTWDPSSDEDTRYKSDELEEVEHILQNGTTGIALGSEAFSPGFDAVCVDEIPGAISPVSAGGERIESFIVTEQTFEGLNYEENAFAVVKLQSREGMEEGVGEQEELGASIQALEEILGEENIVSETDLKEHDLQLSSSHDEDGKHPLCVNNLSDDSAPDKQVENLSHGKTLAISQSRKNMEQILTVGLKMIIVIGSLTLGFLKFKASKLKLEEKS